MEEARERFENELRQATAARIADGGRLVSSDDDETLLNVCTKLCARSLRFPGSPPYLFEAIIAVEETLARWQNCEAIEAEFLLPLSEFYVRRSGLSDTPEQNSREDLNRAINLREHALALPSPLLNSPARGAELEKLASFYVERYERYHMTDDIEQAIRCLTETAGLVDKQRGRELLAECRCLKLKGGDLQAVDCALDIAFDEIPKQPVSLDSVTRRRYRFLDCNSFASGSALRILEFEDLPQNRYIAISYVWRGRISAADPGAVMTIKNANNADPISIEVLRIACVAALNLKCELLWLDGLCIMQGDEEDKGWQIQNMHRIYHSCNACLILPGGLSRLVAIDEETAWIHRAWTLQEAIAPSRCLCLFAWPHGDCTLQAIFFARVAEVEPKTAAMADMRQLLAVNVGYVNTIYYDGPTIENDTRPAKVDVRLLGHRHKDRVPQDALIGAIELKGSTGMGTAIWRAAFTRTSSRPVDFILSIMGLLGVTLDPGQFTENDKLGASIALMRALLENGQRPEWLGIAPNVNPGAELTMLPVFPEPDADGRACYPSSTDGGKSTASEIMGQLTFWFDDLPTDSAMDDEGYLTISALAVSVQSFAHGSHPTFKSTQGVQWVVSPERRSPAYAVLIGKKRYYANGAYPTRKEPFNNVLLLVEEHEPARFRCLGYANVRDEVLGLEGWTTMALRIK